MELAGKVIAVLEPKGGVSKSTGNPWKTQDYVIETHEQFPRRMVFNVFGEDKINQFNIQLNEEINVFFDINAREYQGRWFNDIRAWRIDRNVGDQAASPVVNAQPVSAPEPPAFEQQDSTEDLPF